MQLLFSQFKQYFADSEKTSFLVNIKLARDLRVGGARFNIDLPAKQLVHFLKGLRKYMSLLPSLEVEV